MLVIAHRGSSGTAPENTLAAFRRAVRDGAGVIELDVRLSADGEPVVFHDRRLERMTGGRGSVKGTTAVELEKLPVRWPSGRLDASATIPRLATVLRTLPPAMGLDIEVKTDGDHGRSAVMVKRLGELLHSVAGTRKILVSSFDHAFLRRFHRDHPGVALGVLYAAARDRGRAPASLARRSGASAFICSSAQLQARWLPALHAAGIALLVFGVDREQEALSLRNKGVDGVITNFPARLCRALSIHA
jgi:glycerophosphoryl diester phosphodiesterase